MTRPVSPPARSAASSDEGRRRGDDLERKGGGSFRRRRGRGDSHQTFDHDEQPAIVRQAATALQAYKPPAA
jgi:hypothetical protein